MNSYFPVEIWREILLKLPVESLIRFTTVCKSWKSLITSPDFIYTHLSHPKNLSFFRRFDNKHEHYSLLDFTGENGSSVMKSSSEFEFPFKARKGFYIIVGYCDGMLCLTEDIWFTSLTSQAQPVILWNPCVRNHVVLPPPEITNTEGSQFAVLGFGVANNVYKVVRLVYCMKDHELDYSVPPQVEVFSLGTGRWRGVCGSDIKVGVVPVIWCQVLLKGIVHWLGHETIDNGTSRRSILAFDVGDEVFGVVKLPDLLARESLGSLGVYKIGGSLAVVKSADPFTSTNSCDIWVMKEYGVKDSWTKLYRIDLAENCKNKYRIVKVVGFMNGEALLAYHWPYMGQGWLDLVSYNLETKQAKDLEIYGTLRSLYIDDYVESLLLLKGNSVPAVEECGEPLEGLDRKKE